MTDTSWSRLLHTEMGDLVMSRMDGDPRLRYHNGGHVRRMYERAGGWRLPYDPTLDAAVLWHDSVYDSEPEKEIRSAEWMRDTASLFPDWFVDVDLSRASELILSTTSHIVIPEVSSHLIKLDLFELGIPERRRANFWNIMEESCSLYGVDISDAAQSTLDFMSHFATTMSENSVKDFWSNQFPGDGDKYWPDIVRGVQDTSIMAQTIVDLYDQGLTKSEQH